MRLLASLPHYLATRDDARRADPPVRERRGRAAPHRHRLPWHGRVEIEVTEPGDWTLSLRVPAWAEGATVDGEPAPAGEYARVRRAGGRATR